MRKGESDLSVRPRQEGKSLARATISAMSKLKVFAGRRIKCNSKY